MDALALLSLQIEWGADEALDDAPVDRLRAVAPERPAASPSIGLTPATQASATLARPMAPATSPTPAAPAGTAAERALAAAGAALDLDALRAAIAAFDGCVLRDTATKPVLPRARPPPACC